MMKLFIKTLSETDSGYIVGWSKGLKTKGLIKIEDITTEDPQAAAELAAMQYLIFDANVFNREILNGKGFQFACDPLIARIYNAKTTRKHLIPLMHFFKMNLDGCLVTAITDSEQELLPSLDDPDAPLITIKPSQLDSDYQAFDTPALGKIRLTHHAVEKFTQRLHSGEASNPRLSLIKRLRHPELQRKQLPDKVEKQKIQKYGTIENTEIWGHDSSQMNYVVIRDLASHEGTLVTVYKRHPEYQ